MLVTEDLRELGMSRRLSRPPGAGPRTLPLAQDGSTFGTWGVNGDYAARLRRVRLTFSPQRLEAVTSSQVRR